MEEIIFPTPYEFVIDVLFTKVWRIDPNVHGQQELDSTEDSSITAESRTKDGRLPSTSKRQEISRH